MPNVQKVMNLAKKIAVKARDLVPRSSNRIAHYDETDSLVGSGWKDAPLYVQLVHLAQRSTNKGEAAKLRKLLREGKFDVSFGKTLGQEQAKRTNVDQRMATLLHKEGVNVDDLITKLQASPRAHKVKHKNGADYTPLERVEGTVKSAVRYSIGNCGECSATAYMMLMDYYAMGEDKSLPTREECKGATVELVSLGGKAADHSFVIVNRNTTCNLADTGKWMTSSVIICDPWWFHKGDAILATDDRDGLVDYIRSAAKNSKTVWCPKCSEIESAAQGKKVTIGWPGWWSEPSDGCYYKLLGKGHEPEWFATMAVLNTGAIGSGHSARFRSSNKQHKYRGLNYFLNDNQSIRKQLA